MKNLTKILALVLVACTLMCLVVSCGGKKPVLLAVSFGSSYNETRDATIGAVENALKAAYPARSSLTFWKNAKKWKSTI